MRPSGCGGRDLAYWAHGKPISIVPILGVNEGGDSHTRSMALVNGVRINVLFDTGASTSVLSLDAARRAGVKPSDPGVIPADVSRGVGRNLMRTWIAPFASFQLGDEQVKTTRLRIGDTGLDGVDMLLGADFFLSHRVYVANSQRKIYFTYNGGPVFNLSQQPQVAGDPQASPGAAAQPEPQADAVPTDADGFARRAAAETARGGDAEALKDYAKAGELAPNDPDYAFRRAEVRIAMHQPFLAMGDLDAALKLKPDDVEALVLRARLRLSGHDPTGAKSDVDTAAAVAAKPADVRLGLGALYIDLDQLPPAIAQFDLWIKAHGDDSRLPLALNGRCWARALANQELDHALSDCNVAVRRAPRTGEPLVGRALAQLRRGDLAHATADADAALKLQPKDHWALYIRGLAELKSGDKAQGDADLATVASGAPRLAARAAKLGITP